MTWWNRKTGLSEFPGDTAEADIIRAGAAKILAEETAKRKTRTKTEFLHETKISIKGNEPFLRFPKSHMIVNLSAGLAGSHTLFEGWVYPFPHVKQGDVLAVQIVRLTQVPMTWWERVQDWWGR